MTRATGAPATPLDDGFYLPADDCRHAQVWLPWSHDPAMQDALATLVRIVERYEPTCIIAPSRDSDGVRAACGPVTTVALPYDSLRLRDTGPSFLVDGKGGAAATDWQFNGWGQRDTAGRDATFAHELLGYTEIRRFRAPLTLEPSAFTTDSEGTLLALAACIFDPRRNPDVARLDAFAILQRWLGAARVVWIKQALAQDGLCTDVRALAAFLGPGVIAVASAPTGHPYAETLAHVRAGLMKAKDARGRHFTVVELHVPDAAQCAAARAPLSYTNFLPINGAVLVPVFGAATDDNALEVLGRAFPGRPIEAVPADVFAAHGLTLTSLAVPQPARLLQRDRATTLPRSAWSHAPPDVDAILQKYIDMADEPP